MKGRLIPRAALGAVVLAALVSVSLAAPPPPYEHYMKGEVTRSKRPLRSAWVILSQNGVEKGRSLTADDGRYYIGDLGNGEYQVVVKQGTRSVFEGSVRLPEQRINNIEVTRH